MKHSSRTAAVINAALTPFVKAHQDPAGAWSKVRTEVEEGFGGADPAFAENFGVILTDFARLPNISPIGWVFINNELKSRYANRLRIQRLLQERPEIEDEAIEAPVFVCGLPRTATTLTHRVLAISDEHRGPLSWEMLNTGLYDPEVEKKEIAAGHQATRITGILNPALDSQHPSRPQIPEESMMLLPNGLFWEMLHGELPNYRARLARHDMTPDYAYLKQCLQILQHQRPRKRWILKYPGHVADMTQIRAVFPDATFVWTHRDPATVIGSVCSLVETLWSIYQTRPDREAIGRLAMEVFTDLVDKGLEARLALPPSAIVDVPYHRMAADPYQEVPNLYRAIGATWKAADEANLAEAMARPKGARPHTYELSRYGLDEDEVAAAFVRYLRLLDRFDERGAQAVSEL